MAQHASASVLTLALQVILVVAVAYMAIDTIRNIRKGGW